MATRRLEVLITGNAKDAQRALGDLERSASKSGKATQRHLSGIQSGLIGLGVGAAALGSFKAFEESEKIARQTEAVIKSTGGEAQVTADHIGDLATEMSKLGGVDDELVQSGANMLLTFTKVRNEVGKGNDIFDQATLAANNYAAATGTDVVNANKMLGKALQDPIKGLTALTRAGVSFTQQQKDQIRALVAAGDTMGAQKIILAEFNKEYGGSLEANATATGKARVALENFGESVGSIVAPGLTVGADAVGGLAQAFGSLAPELQASAIALGTGAVVWVRYGDNIRSAVSAVTTGVPAAVSGAKALGGAIGQIAATRGVSKTTATIEVLKSSMSGLSTTAIVGATATAGIAAAFVKMQVDAERAKNNVKDLQRQIEAGMDPVDAVTIKLTNTLAGLDGGFEGLAGSSAQFRKNLKEAGITASDVADIVKMPADEWKRYSQELLNTEGMSKHQASQMVTNLAKIRDASSGAVDAERIRKDLVKETGVETDKLADDTNAVAEALEAWSGVGGAVAAANDTITESIKDQYDAQKALNDETQIGIDMALGQVDASLGAAAAHDAVQDAQKQLAEVDKKIADARNAVANAATPEEQQSAQGTLNDLLASRPEDIQRAQDALTAAITRETEATLAAEEAKAKLEGRTLTAGEKTDILRWKLAELKTQTGFTSEGLDTLSANLDDVARQRTISIDTSQAIENIASLIDVIKNLSQVGSATGAAGSLIDAGISGALANLGRPAGGKAVGGSVVAGSMNLVGERGPELVRWGANGTVIPAYKTKQMLSGTSVNAGSSSMGGGNTIHVTVVESKDARATAREVVAEINRQTRMGGRPLVSA